MPQVRIASITFALVFAFVALMQAQAVRPTVQDGVYSDAQATRGQTLYALCAGCHGPALTGAQAPPLVGDAFIAKWRMEPLSALFIKIRYTMPPAAPATLTSEQAVDLLSHILKTNALPA